MPVTLKPLVALPICSTHRRLKNLPETESICAQHAAQPKLTSRFGVTLGSLLVMGPWFYDDISMKNHNYSYSVIDYPHSTVDPHVNLSVLFKVYVINKMLQSENIDVSNAVGMTYKTRQAVVEVISDKGLQQALVDARDICNSFEIEAEFQEPEVRPQKKIGAI
ncbi:hypothetical protein AVEN_258739-1 [Araneus ventricosus]|uniref:Uncharacterized protein n=1 Tax=Araneus ventricosus TaxID=182803 RepID=A0A4Y2D054_ARAVE|nr:hypothetical protein AVEN_258739-1 [Araneus ventricosus]